MGSCEVPHLVRFSRFDVYWIQTDKKTDRQSKYIYLYRLSKNQYEKVDNHSLYLSYKSICKKIQMIKIQQFQTIYLNL